MKTTKKTTEHTMQMSKAEYGWSTVLSLTNAPEHLTEDDNLIDGFETERNNVNCD